MLAILQTTGTVPCDKLREAIPATDRLNDPDSVGFNSARPAMPVQCPEGCTPA